MYISVRVRAKIYSIKTYSDSCSQAMAITVGNSLSLYKRNGTRLVHLISLDFYEGSQCGRRYMQISILSEECYNLSTDIGFSLALTVQP